LGASAVKGGTLGRCLSGGGWGVEEGARLERCVIGVRSRLGKNVTLRDTVLIGADRFETDAERAANRQRGIPDFTVGDGAVIERAILDKDCRVGRGVRIVNQRGVTDDEGDNYVIRDGIVTIPRGTIV